MLVWTRMSPIGYRVGTLAPSWGKPSGDLGGVLLEVGFDSLTTRHTPSVLSLLAFCLWFKLWALSLLYLTATSTRLSNDVPTFHKRPLPFSCQVTNPDLWPYPFWAAWPVFCTTATLSGVQWALEQTARLLPSSLFSLSLATQHPRFLWDLLGSSTPVSRSYSWWVFSRPGCLFFNPI